jgi:hypothetical protein
VAYLRAAGNVVLTMFRGSRVQSIQPALDIATFNSCSVGFPPQSIDTTLE